jgi:hypothetical protein
VAEGARDVERGVRDAGRSDGARKIVLFGWAAKGIVYVALAWIVLQSAFGSVPEEASTTGALQLVARTVPGGIALVVLGLGLIAYAIGRVLEVTALGGPQIGARDKAAAAVLAVVHVALAITAFGIVGLAGGGGSSGNSEEQGSAFLLSLPGGQLLAGVAGAGLAALGVYEGYKGIAKRFLPTLRTGEMSAGLRSATEKIGVAAYLTKGFLFILIGYSFVQAAVTYDPSQAQGLDATLHDLAQSTFGRVALPLVAIGLLAYGGLALIQSRYRRIGSSATGTT